MIQKQDRNKARKIRHLRLRKKIIGSPERPRLNVFRSSKHMYAQVINDQTGTTIAAASTLDRAYEKGESGATIAAAQRVGQLLAKRAKEKGITQVVFDRGGYLYHGRIAALADAVRAEGIKF
ncbi:MAG: 50S ribosomal protein L18 [Paenibacillaceae bacterium]|jgi:large subunit ribosomal protein L18|nr:50S ribosomal protein L18 [Paenibacillaceae bacterium]